MPLDTAPSARKHAHSNSALPVALAPVALAAYYCIGHLDRDVAEFVRQHLYASTWWRHTTGSLPDFLAILVVSVTAVSYSLFRRRAYRHGIDGLAVMYKTLSVVAPASYVVKTALKYAFGRTNTREWLRSPQEYGFHWFSGDVHHSGFPSGHMLVATALAATVWRFRPRYRPACLGLLAVLAMAMVATDYHFVSDVIAGTYAGLVVEAWACRVTRRKYYTLHKTVER